MSLTHRTLVKPVWRLNIFKVRCVSIKASWYKRRSNLNTRKVGKQQQPASEWYSLHQIAAIEAA